MVLFGIQKEIDFEKIPFFHFDPALRLFGSNGPNTQEFFPR